MDPKAIEILNKVKSGELSVEEAAQRLHELETGSGDQGASGFGSETAGLPGERMRIIDPMEMPREEEPLPDLGWWRTGWLIPFWIGAAILVLSALWMGTAYSNHNFFWFYCSWLPMLFGLLVLFLSWWSQQARWVHVRVKEADGKRVAISLPLPLGLASRLLSMFGRYIPNMDPQVLEGLPEIIDAMAKEKGSTSVEVDEKDGTRVRVYIL